MNRNRICRLNVCAALALTACAAAHEETPMKNATIVATDGLAIDGFDPVSYLAGSPVLGRAEYELNWSGVRWRFASADNRARFEQAPDRYAPQYGGHCALAMSLGEVAPSSPTAWSIEKGKLYFHNSAITAFLFKYLPGRLRAADQRWSAFESQTTNPEAKHGKESL